MVEQYQMEVVPTLETLSSYEEEAKNTHLTSSLFYKDTASKMDKPDPTKAKC